MLQTSIISIPENQLCKTRFLGMSKKRVKHNLITSLEFAFVSWLTSKILQVLKDQKIMVMISDVQAKIAELEQTIQDEKLSVAAAIDAYAAKVKEALDAAANSGQDLSVLITDLQRVEDEIKAIYTPPEPVQ